MKQFICIILILFPAFLSAQTLKKLKIKETEPPEKAQPVGKSCSKDNTIDYVVFSTAVKNLKFKGRRVLKTDTTDLNRYVVCLSVGPKPTKTTIIIYGDDYEENVFDVTRNCWYEIQPKKTFKEIMTPTNNQLVVLLGKGYTYSSTGGGFGGSALWRFGTKVGFGLQMGIGYYSMETKEHLGNQIHENSYSIDNSKTNFLHWSSGLKCYPLKSIKIKNDYIKELIDGAFLYSSYGTLGTIEMEAYNKLDGSFSLGGTKTMYGVSIMLGEDYFLIIGKKKNSGILINFGLGCCFGTGKKGTDYKINDKNCKFSYDIAVGWCWNLDRSK
jgi:hypothetical protein